MDYLAEGIRTKPGGTDVLHEMTFGLRSSETRIKDILGEVEGDKIIKGLYEEILKLAEGRSFGSICLEP